MNLIQNLWMTQIKQTAQKHPRKQVRPATCGKWVGIKQVGWRAPYPTELHWVGEDLLKLHSGNFQWKAYDEIPRASTTVVDAQHITSEEAVIKTPVQMEAEVHTASDLVRVSLLLSPNIAYAFSPTPLGLGMDTPIIEMALSTEFPQASFPRISPKTLDPNTLMCLRGGTKMKIFKKVKGRPSPASLCVQNMGEGKRGWSWWRGGSRLAMPRWWLPRTCWGRKMALEATDSQAG